MPCAAGTFRTPRFERGNATRANRLRERREPARASERGETRGNPGSRAAQRVCRGSRARRGARGRPYAGGRSREGRAKPLRTPKRKGGRSLSTETDAARGPRGARVWRGRTGEKRERAARQTGGSVKTFYGDNRRQPGNNRQASQ